ncbi:MAG TPA: M56 family metallopeptidase [Bryobacteraceae bacterium]|jgi:uncharacterized protein (TIGR03435 family)
MLSELTNHVWQSTIFALAVGLIIFAFRRNRAQVRYWLWFSASCKFLVPLSLLISLGTQFEWVPVSQKIAAAPAVQFTLVQISQPFPSALPLTPATAATHDWAALAIFGVWVCGFAVIVLIRYRGWRCIRAAVRSSTPINILGTMQVRSSPGLLEPGIVGLFRPILLLPTGIAERLEPHQLQAVLAHELCHVRRHDNLTSAIHMLVEAAFWFHPLVWWIGARLVEERERACDEAVLSLGNEPGDYAEGILNVCKCYLESPLSCVSGVTGSNLKKRIHAILTGRIARDLSFAKKLALAAAGIAALGAPIVVGIVSAPRVRAESPTLAQLAATPKFETVSIKRCQAYSKRPLPDSPGMLQSGCKTVEQFVAQAYGVFANGHANRLSSVAVTGGPPWARSDFYEVDAKAEGRPSFAMMNGPMLQALLENRFKLKIHRETKEVPVYALTVSEGGPPLQPFQGSCIPWDYDNPPSHPAPPSQRCGNPQRTSNAVDFDAATMTDLCYFLLVTLDRPVIDETGMSGRRFNFHLEMPTEAIKDLRHGARGAPAVRDPRTPANSSDPSLISAIKTAIKKLGLNLKPTEGPGEFLDIDHIERLPRTRYIRRTVNQERPIA